MNNALSAGLSAGEMARRPAPTLHNIINKRSLKWIFVGGKGGVGKTTCSSALSVELSRVRESVLLLSTDPAHNLSDAFRQQFTSKPTLVNGFDNLFVMELDPSLDLKMEDVDGGPEEAKGPLAILKDFIMPLPGMDEVLGLAEIMKQVTDLRFDVVVFDTAPTGHTLRLLNLPNVLAKMLGQMSGMKGAFMSMQSQLAALMGSQFPDIAALEERMTAMQGSIDSLNRQFRDPALTTFICVCIPEFLSLYETERLIQELTKFEIDAGNLVINQVLFPDPDKPCNLCRARTALQRKYIRQIEALYEDFHIVKLPLLRDEVHGVEGCFGLKSFGDWLQRSYEDAWKVGSLQTEEGGNK